MAIDDSRWNFETKTKDGEAEYLKDVNVQVFLPFTDPKRHYDTSVWNLEGIDIILEQYDSAQIALFAKVAWFEKLRERVLIEAEKVELKVIR